MLSGSHKAAVRVISGFALGQSDRRNLMTQAAARIRSTPADLEQISTRIVFFITGLAMAAWAPLVPFAKARVGMNDAMLGLLLLYLGIGSIVAMPLAGALAARVGCRRVIIVSALIVCLALPLLALVSSLPLLVAALLIFGGGLGAIDVAMNIQAITVERASGRPMMSGFHGLFSFGGIVGSAGITALLGAGASPIAAALVITTGIAVALAKAAPHLLPYGGKTEGPAFALPHGVVLFIGGLCFILFLAEGAVLDWSAVFLTSVREVNPSYAGLGYAAFALTMTIGRLAGDRIVPRFGKTSIIGLGGTCAATGFALVALVPSWPVALLGYALVGAGCSNIVPVLFTGVGTQNAMPENVAVPAITTLGYAGILVGPAAIGLMAHTVSLSAAFLIVAAMLLAVAGSSRLLHL
jgi:predicted MFS family arabinose efflux permease